MEYKKTQVYDVMTRVDDGESIKRKKGKLRFSVCSGQSKPIFKPPPKRGPMRPFANFHITGFFLVSFTLHLQGIDVFDLICYIHEV